MSNIVAWEKPVAGELVESYDNISVSTPDAHYVVAKAALDSQIATARAFRRSPQVSLNECKTLATMTPDVAKACIYALPRDGKTIEGPSARFAEIVASAWGNISVSGRIIEETDRHVVALGECIDLEKNSRRTVEVRRRIVDKWGKKYKDDMILTTSNAAISIACRNAVLAVVPRALWDTAYQEAKQTAIGKLRPIVEERAWWLDYFGKQGIKPDEVFAALGVKGADDIGLDQITILLGIDNALKENETTLQAVFRPKPDTVASAKAENLTQALRDVKAAPKKDGPKAADTLFKPVPREPGED